MDDKLWAQPYSPEDVGKYLAEVRKQRGLTQAELAEILGLPRRYVIELEAGKDTRYAQRLFAVFNQLGVEVTLRTDPGAASDQEFQW